MDQKILPRGNTRQPIGSPRPDRKNDLLAGGSLLVLISGNTPNVNLASGRPTIKSGTYKPYPVVEGLSTYALAGDIGANIEEVGGSIFVDFWYGYIYSGGPASRYIFGDYNGTDGYGLAVCHTSGIGWGVFTGGLEQSGESWTVLADGKPHSFVIVRDTVAGTLKVYRDGILKLTTNGAPALRGTYAVGSIGVNQSATFGCEHSTLIAGRIRFKSWNDAQVKSFAQNPWQVFEPRRVSVPSYIPKVYKTVVRREAATTQPRVRSPLSQIGSTAKLMVTPVGGTYLDHVTGKLGTFVGSQVPKSVPGIAGLGLNTLNATAWSTGVISPVQDLFPIGTNAITIFAVVRDDGVVYSEEHGIIRSEGSDQSGSFALGYFSNGHSLRFLLRTNGTNGWVINDVALQTPRGHTIVVHVSWKNGSSSRLTYRSLHGGQIYTATFPVVPTGTSLIGASTSLPTLISGINRSGGTGWPGEMYAVGVWNQYHNEATARSIVENPWSVFEAKRDTYYSIADTSSALAYTLPATVASFTFSGISNALKASRKLVSATSSFSVSNKTSNFALVHKILAANGSLVLNGLPTRTAVGRKIVSAVGTYSLAGGSTGFSKVRFFNAVVGSYAITGNATTIAAGRKVVNSAGSYAVTGNGLSFKAGRKVLGNVGSYSVTGSVSTLLFTRKVNATLGTYSLTGISNGFKVSRSMPFAAGAYALTGNSNALKYFRSVVSSKGTYTLAGNNTAFVFTRKINATPASYAITGNSNSYVYYRKLLANSGSYTLTGINISLSSASSRQIGANPGSFTLTGINTGFKVSRKMVSAGGSYTYSGNTAGLLFTRKVNAVVGAYSATFRPIVFNYTRNVKGTVGSYVVTGTATLLKVSRKVSFTANNFALTGINSSFKFTRVIPLAVNSFNLVGMSTRLAVTRKIINNVELLPNSVGSFIITGNSAALLTASSLNIGVDSGTFSIAGNVLKFKVNRKVTLGVNNYALTGIDANVKPIRRVGVDVGAYGIASDVVSLKVTRKIAVTKSILNINGTIVIIRAARRISSLGGTFTLSYKPITFRAGGPMSYIWFKRFRNMFVSF